MFLIFFMYICVYVFYVCLFSCLLRLCSCFILSINVFSKTWIFKKKKKKKKLQVWSIRSVRTRNRFGWSSAGNQPNVWISIRSVGALVKVFKKKTNRSDGFPTDRMDASVSFFVIFILSCSCDFNVWFMWVNV